MAQILSDPGLDNTFSKSPVVKSGPIDKDCSGDKDSTEEEFEKLSISPAPPEPEEGTLTQEDQDAFSEAVRREIALAKSGHGNTHAPRFGNKIKFSSAETEANTNANSYFGLHSPRGAPIHGDSSDVSDIEGDKSPRVRSRSAHHSRSRSRSAHHHHLNHGVKPHFIDPNSPGAAFEHRIAFDTFDNKNATDFSLTLNSKHEDYKYTRLTRTYLCGTDNNKYSEHAVSWLMDELAEDGDEIVCLRVIDPSSKLGSSDKALEERRYREEAHQFLDHIMSKNKKGKKLSLVLEFALGNVETLIKRMIQIYEPSILIVGTKGRSIEGFKGLLPGSVSKWCLQHSPIPVVVVKPKSKLEGKRLKREANPHKISYLEMVEQHPSETPKIYPQNSSNRTLNPQIPAFLRGSFLRTPVGAGTLEVQSTPNLNTSLDSESLGAERLGRFDRLRARSRSPLPPKRT